jgi:peroxiredoxin
LRDDYEQIRRSGAEVIAIAPHALEDVESLVTGFRLPFPVGADPDRLVFRAYDVASRPWSLGQRPGLFVIDRNGNIRWSHVGWQQWDIPTNARVLAMLEQLASEASAT